MGLVIPLLFLFLFYFILFFIFLRFLRNYVSIIVNIISNNTVLQCYLLWMFASIRRLQLIVCIEVSTPPHLKNIKPSFAKSPLNSSNYPSPLLKVFTHLSPPSKKKFFFSCTTPPLPPKKKTTKIQIFLWPPIILNFFIINLIPSFKSN